MRLLRFLVLIFAFCLFLAAWPFKGIYLGLEKTGRFLKDKTLYY